MKGQVWCSRCGQRAADCGCLWGPHVTPEILGALHAPPASGRPSETRLLVV